MKGVSPPSPLQYTDGNGNPGSPTHPPLLLLTPELPMICATVPPALRLFTPLVALLMALAWLAPSATLAETGEADSTITADHSGNANGEQEGTVNDTEGEPAGEQALTLPEEAEIDTPPASPDRTPWQDAAGRPDRRDARGEEADAMRGEPPHVELALRLEPGMVFTQHLDTHQQMVQQHSGEELDSTLHASVQRVHEVEQVDTDGRATITMTYRLLALRISGLQSSSIALSSERDADEDDPRRLIQAMVDRPITYELDRAGRIGRVEGFKALFNAVASAAEQVEAAEAQWLINLLKRQFGERALRRQFDHLSLLPAEPVGLGGRWSCQTEQRLPSWMRADHRFHLSRFDDDEARIELQSRIEMEQQRPALPSAQAHADLHTYTTLTGTQRGWGRLDRPSGLARELELTTSLTGRIAVRAHTGEQRLAVSNLAFRARTVLTTEIEWLPGTDE